MNPYITKDELYIIAKMVNEKHQQELQTERVHASALFQAVLFYCSWSKGVKYDTCEKCGFFVMFYQHDGQYYGLTDFHSQATKIVKNYMKKHQDTLSANRITKLKNNLITLENGCVEWITHSYINTSDSEVNVCYKCWKQRKDEKINPKRQIIRYNFMDFEYPNDDDFDFIFKEFYKQSIEATKHLIREHFIHDTYSGDSLAEFYQKLID